MGGSQFSGSFPFPFFVFQFKVGHEPIPPAPSRTFLGTKVLRLPSFFQYGKLCKTAKSLLRHPANELWVRYQIPTGAGLPNQ